MTKFKIYFDRHLASINTAVRDYFANDADIELEIENRAGYWSPLKDTLRWYRSFYKRLKNREFDLVHANRSKIALLCMLTKTPFIYSIHGCPNWRVEIHEGFKEFLLTILEITCLKLSYKKARYISGISEYTCREVKERYGFLPHTMYNGYTPAPEQPAGINRSLHNYISVGRLDPCKNPLRVLHVFRNILQKDPQAKLVYLGRGSMEKKFRQKIVEYGLEKNVTYAGFVPFETISKYYYEASYFISACEIEGFGLAALEALSYGCKPLLPPQGAFPEIFPDNTFFYGKDNQPDLTPVKPELRESILKKFTWENALSQWKNLYLSFLEEKTL